MKLLLPNNIYAKLFSMVIPGIHEENIIYTSSSTISRELDEERAHLALIPSMDLLNYNHFFVSGKTAISFDGSLSNSFFYFLKQLRMVKQIFLRGDVSKNDVILTKIIFAEQFETQIEIFLDSKPFEFNARNYLVCGDDNIQGDIFEAGLSLADQVSDLLEAPYVNYVLVSKDEELLKNFTAKIDNLDKILEDNFDNLIKRIDTTNNIKDTIKQNLNSVYFDMTEVEKKSLNTLLQLPYFTQVLTDIVEIKIID